MFEKKSSGISGWRLEKMKEKTPTEKRGPEGGGSNIQDGRRAREKEAGMDGWVEMLFMHQPAHN